MYKSIIKGFTALACLALAHTSIAAPIKMTSPNGTQLLSFDLDFKGAPSYALSYKGKVIVQPSTMGLALVEGGDLRDGFVIERIDSSAVNTTWSPVWGEESSINNNYKELSVLLRQDGSKPRKMLVTFRVFNDGIGFRYSFPQQPNLFHFSVKDEHTYMRLAGNHKAWWLPGDYDTNEYPPREGKMSSVFDWKPGGDDEIFAKT
ncbi:MAG: hypothetical protein RL660_740, partial [Bacteroidota bacterium]